MTGTGLPLNRATAPQVLRLFDLCFRQGVFDAYDQDDDYAVREFLEKHKENGGYGLVYDDDNFDWRRWRYTIARWCRENRLGSVGNVYLDSPELWKGYKTFLFAVIPISMRFYLMGVEEWLENPNPGRIPEFKMFKKTHFKNVPSHLKEMSTQDFISYIQEFVYERQRLHIKNDLTDRQYDSFAQAMWTLTKKYPPIYDPTKEKVRNNR